MIFNRKPKPPAPFDTDALTAAWARYVSKATSLHAPFRDLLQPGASAAQIAERETKIDCALTDDLRHLLSLNNGQTHGEFCLPGWELFPATRIVDEWSVWSELYHSQFKPEGYTSDGAGEGIQKDEWFRLKWIPFCGDGGGNHLCLDMDPDKDGQVGQIITMWHDMDERVVVAPSLTDFIETIAADIEAGELVWNEEWGGIYEPFDEDE